MYNSQQSFHLAVWDSDLYPPPRTKENCLAGPIYFFSFLSCCVSEIDPIPQQRGFRVMSRPLKATATKKIHAPATPPQLPLKFPLLPPPQFPKYLDNGRASAENRTEGGGGGVRQIDPGWLSVPQDPFKVPPSYLILR